MKFSYGINSLILLVFSAGSGASVNDLSLLKLESARLGSLMATSSSRVHVSYNGVMDIGYYDISVSQLRERLLEEGYAVVEESDPQLYDDALKATVSFYQEDHGLTPDGVVGAATISLLNDSNEVKFRKLQIAIEKLEALDIKQNKKTIIVNIPTYTLRAYDGDALFLDSKVIVGMPSRKTPEMETSLSQLKINPDWTVPVSILKKDYFQKIKNYRENNLEGRGYYVSDSAGNEIPFSDVAAYSVNEFLNSGLMLKQSSGDGNALGRIKFVLRNSDSIYLHDTNNRTLFNRGKRDLSSGCVRVEDYMELASWAYGGYISDLQDKINENKTTYLNTDEVKVFITYLPAFVVNGKIKYADDIYRKLDL